MILGAKCSCWVAKGVKGMSQVQIGRWAPGFHNMSIMEGLCKLGKTDNDGCIKVPIEGKVDMAAFHVLEIDPRVVELGAYIRAYLEGDS